MMPRTWKCALAPTLAGIPERTGFVGEARFGLLNDWRRGERALDRMIDQNAALALPPNAPLRLNWPPPQLVVPLTELMTGESRQVSAKRRRSRWHPER